MANSLSLGKEFGEIDFSKLKSGITKKDLGIEEGSVLATIFDSINTDNEGDSKDKLDRNELNVFIQKVLDLAGKNRKLSAGEAKKYETAEGEELGGKNKKELLQFLKNLSSLTNGISAVEQEENSEKVTYEDGHTVETFKDGSTLTTYIDKDKNTVTYIGTDKDGKTETVVEKDENGNPVQETEIKYDQDGNQTKKTVRTGDDVKTYLPDGNGSWKVYKEVYGSEENPTKTVKYNSNGTVTVTEGENETIYSEYSDENKQIKQQTIKDGNRTEVSEYDGKNIKNKSTTTIKDGVEYCEKTDFNDEGTTTTYLENGKKTKQVIIKNGESYTVEYDGEGNTKGVIVQNGESLASIAKKFNCSPQELIALNPSKVHGKYPNAWFAVGEGIKVKGEIPAEKFSELQAGRASSEEAVAQYNTMIAERKAAAESARNEMETIVTGKNGYSAKLDANGNAHYYDNKGKEISAKEFKAHGPSMYQTVQDRLKGVVRRTRNKYPVSTLEAEGEKLASKLYRQIDGASLNENTIALLRKIHNDNVAFVVLAYQQKFGVSLAKDIDDEWGLDVKTIKTHICAKLEAQAKAVGIKIKQDYRNIDKIEQLENWINQVATAIKNKMTNAKETYTVKVGKEATEDARETKRAQKAENSQRAEIKAKDFYNISKDNSGNSTMKEMSNYINRNLNKSNIVAFLDAYDKIDKGSDTSVIDTVTSEITAGSGSQEAVLYKLWDLLCQAAKDAGVSDKDIADATKAFKDSWTVEKSAHGRRTNPINMENAMTALRSAILTAQSGVKNVNESEAMQDFANDFKSENDEATKAFEDARKEDGWTANMGDTICGWFGCNTVEDLRAKLGNNAQKIEKLVELAKKNDINEFKKLYKELFGIEFDAKKIAAAQEYGEKMIYAQTCAASIPKLEEILNQAKGKDYNSLIALLKSKLGYTDETINIIIDEYNKETGENVTTDSDKQKVLLESLRIALENAREGYETATDGKTIEEMQHEYEILRDGAFGTNNISKAVRQFNENMVMTELATDIGLEVLGTIALSLIPGAGAAAAGKLAMSLAKLGCKTTKAFKYATKIRKGFKTFQKVTTATKKAKVITASANAGVATATVEKSSGKDWETTIKKTLMNMSFAGAGATASILAPQLAQALGVSNKLATEVVEEILNAIASGTIVYASGDTYGSQDAFIDFATGLIMSRISHGKASVKGGKTHTDSHITTKPDYVPPKGTSPDGIIPQGAKKEADGTVKIKNNNPDVESESIYYFDKDGNIIGSENIINGEKHLLDAQGNLVSEEEFVQIKKIHDEKTPVLDRISKNTQEGSVGKLNEENYAELRREVEYKLAHATTKEELDALEKEIKKLQVRDQKRPLLQQIEAKRAQLETLADSTPNAKAENEGNASKVDETPNAEKASTTDETPHTEETGSAPKQKAYADMEPEELFAEYHRLKMETQYAPLSTTQQAENITKMKELEGLLDKKGFRIEGDKYVKKESASSTSKSDKSNGTENTSKPSDADAEINNASNQKARVKEVFEQYGKKVSKQFNAVLNQIKKLKNLKDFDKISKYIQDKFANYKTLANELIDNLAIRAKAIGLKIGDKIDVLKAKFKSTTNSATGTPRKPNTAEMNNYELCRENGNGGRPIPESYVQNSKEVREHLNDAIESGDYTKDVNSYKKAMEKAHKLAYAGKSGKNRYYKKKGHDELYEMEAGKVRKGGRCGSFEAYLKEAEQVEQIAKKYGDPFRRGGLSTVKLEGIPDDILPYNNGMASHAYPPGGKALDAYYTQMHRTAKEALELIEQGASDREILEKIAEHFQYAANARPYMQINNSLFMTEINTLLKKAGLKTIPHGILDHAAQRLQPEAFKKYFVDEYHRTKLDDGIPGASRKADSTPPQRTYNKGEQEAFAQYNKSQPARTFNENSHGTLHPTEHYELNMNKNLPVLRLCDGTIIDLNSPEFRNEILNLKNGEYLTIGREGSIPVNSNNTVSRNHLLIVNDNGKIMLQDVSSNKNTKKISKDAFEARTDATKKFNPRQSAEGLPNAGKYMDANAQYVLDIDELPSFRLIDGTVVDLNDKNIKLHLSRLNEGQFLTLGRQGKADIGISSSNYVSGQHLLITRQNGKLIIKDISKNQQTFVMRNGKASNSYSTNNNSGTNGTNRNANRAEHSSNLSPEQQRRIRTIENTIRRNNTSIEGLEADIKRKRGIIQSFNLSDAQINEYKKILGIPDNIELTKDSLKKAYRPLTIKYHPDRTKGNKALESEFLKIQDAYEKLSKHLNRDAEARPIISQIEEVQNEIDKLKAENKKLQEQIKAVHEEKAEAVS